MLITVGWLLVAFSASEAEVEKESFQARASGTTAAVPDATGREAKNNKTLDNTKMRAYT